MSRLENYDTIESMIDETIKLWTGMLKDADKFDKGNKSAGRRVRKQLQEAKKEADFIRKSVLNKIKGEE